jgi:hypothetical protein
MYTDPCARMTVPEILARIAAIDREMADLASQLATSQLAARESYRRCDIDRRSISIKV